MLFASVVLLPFHAAGTSFQSSAAAVLEYSHLMETLSGSNPHDMATSALLPLQNSMYFCSCPSKDIPPTFMPAPPFTMKGVLLILLVLPPSSFPLNTTV